MAGHRQRLREFLESGRFQHFIVFLIVINSLSIGMETSRSWMNAYGDWFDFVDNIILGIFILEVVLKVYAFGFRFFKSAWNVFDFAIVAVAMMPTAGAFSIFRTMRILRTLRLIKNVPKLRIIIEALIKSVPSIGWISVLTVTVFYIFAVLANNLYGEQFPQWFGDIGDSMFTLFQIMTLESWSTGIARPMMEKVPHAYLFFVPFILIATYTTLNIFIAIVVNTMNELHRVDTEDEEKAMKDAIFHNFNITQRKLDELTKKIDELSSSTKHPVD